MRTIAKEKESQDSEFELSCEHERTDTVASGIAVNTYCEDCGELVYSK